MCSCFALNRSLLIQQIGDLTITATLNPELYGWINSTNNVSFSYGFDFQASGSYKLQRPRLIFLWHRFRLALSCFFRWNLSTTRYLLDCKHLVLE